MLALALHGVLLFGVPIDRWAFRFPRPQQFEVVLLLPEAVVLPSASNSFPNRLSTLTQIRFPNLG
ncbi:MAG: hypothetical protein R3F37_21980 [Candidatus Competibacteraceae bacterium]